MLNGNKLGRELKSLDQSGVAIRREYIIREFRDASVRLDEYLRSQDEKGSLKAKSRLSRVQSKLK